MRNDEDAVRVRSIAALANLLRFLCAFYLLFLLYTLVFIPHSPFFVFIFHSPVFVCHFSPISIDKVRNERCNIRV